jgi:hypothetical protein
MKKLYSIFFVALLSFLLLGMGQAGTVLQMEKFSVNVPAGWIVQKESESKVVIVMPEAKNEEISISISANPTSSTVSLDEAWNKIKPSMVAKRKVIYDGEDSFPPVTWKKLEIREVVCEKEMRKVVLFTMRNAAKYLVQFDCPEDKFGSMLPVFTAAVQSIKYK